MTALERRARRRARIVCVLASLLLAACGTQRLASSPLPETDLSGQWVLDTAASDDAARLIAAALPVPKALRPRQEESDSERAPPQRTDDGGRGGRRGGRSGGDRSQSQSPARSPQAPSAWGRLTPRDFVDAFVLPPERLDVAQQPMLVRVGAGDWPRTFQPGDEEVVTLNDRFGSRAVRAGWRADAFVITSQDGARLDVVEQLHRGRDDRLERIVEFHARAVKALRVRSVYRRATAQELQTGQTVGPPLPIR